MRIEGGIYTAAICFALLVVYAKASDDTPVAEPESDVCDTEEKKKAFHKCFDELKNDVLQEQENFYKELCDDANKDNLDCVIKKLNECPKYIEEQDVKVFKHMKSALTPKDLLHVSSADEFCKCTSIRSCLAEIDGEKLGVDNNDSRWDMLANRNYICGIGRQHIDCVAAGLPVCARYLQFKHNNTVESSMETYYEVDSLEYASIFAEKHCKNWPNDNMNDSCVKRRSEWYSVEVCFDQANNYRSEENVECGLRRCIEKAMISCPEGSMEYFIDSANVFGTSKIAREKCPSSSSSTLLATLTSLLIALYVSTFL